MKRAIVILLTLAALCSSTGCATDGDAEDAAMNELWRQGYGFNNPNSERIRNREPPLNFDGPKSK